MPSDLAIEKATLDSIIELIDSERRSAEFYDVVGLCLGQDLSKREDLRRKVDRALDLILRRIRGK